MKKGKLRFTRNEIKVGAIYGIYFPETITRVIRKGEHAFMVELTDEGHKRYGALKVDNDGLYEMRITSPDFDGVEEWYEVYERG